MKSIFLILLFFAGSLVCGADKVPCETYQKELRAVRLVPFVADGLVKGWAIREISHAPQLQKRGVEERDLLVRLSGIELNSPENLTKALEQMCLRRGSLQVTRRKKSFAVDLW